MLLQHTSTLQAGAIICCGVGGRIVMTLSPPAAELAPEIAHATTADLIRSLLATYSKKLKRSRVPLEQHPLGALTGDRAVRRETRLIQQRSDRISRSDLVACSFIRYLDRGSRAGNGRRQPDNPITVRDRHM
jgi:hypothetical protein